MEIMTWCGDIKESLVDLQRKTGIPALFAVAQMAHESNSGGQLSQLATLHHNYAGLKYAEWQAEMGGRPVLMNTWEEVAGRSYKLADSFCSCNSYEQWLDMYASLLTGRHYGPALAYAADPLLYAYMIWSKGWATDSRYIVKIGEWMTKLWPLYEDTLPPRKYPNIPVESGDHPDWAITGEVRDETTWVPVRALVEKLGLGSVQYVADGPKVIVRGHDGWTP